MNDEIKTEDQLPGEALAETYARFVQRVFEVARIIQEQLQTVAERVAPYLEAMAQID
jgi:hypothetical protein